MGGRALALAWPSSLGWRFQFAPDARGRELPRARARWPLPKRRADARALGEPGSFLAGDDGGAGIASV